MLHCANARSLDIPSVIKAAKTASQPEGTEYRASASGTTAHSLSRCVRLKAHRQQREYNIEGNPFTGRFMI
jgi:hypothetical protein